MKILLLVFAVFPFSSYGQSDNPDNLSEKAYSLKAKKIAPAEIKLPFSRIRIIDSRFDTTKFGYVLSGNPFRGHKTAFKKATFKGGIGQSIEEYYNEYYEHAFQENGFRLLVVMKKFWISGVGEDKNNSGEIQTTFNVANHIYVKWEYYLEKDSNYLPLKRIDTVFSITESVEHYVEEEFDEKKLSLIKFYLKGMIEILNYDKAVSVFDNQPRKKMDWILNYNANRFKIPVLQESTIQKGVFKTFDEFIKNKPGRTAFKEKKTTYETFKKMKFITDPEGNNITDYWAYCDGEDIVYGPPVNDKLYRTGNTFELLRKVNWTFIDENPSNRVNSFATKSKAAIWYPYQLDMETGKFY